MLVSVALALTTLAVADPPSTASPPSGRVSQIERLATTPPRAVDTWTIDVAHSELTFSIRHLVSKVRGEFTQWNGTISADANDWSSASVNVTIQTASINTNKDARDNHLRSADFFDATTYPTITFKSTKVERNGDDLKLYGDLTMRGVTKPIVLAGKFAGIKKDAKGKLRAGFDVSATINRTDYGVSWNRAAEGGGVTLSNDVNVEISIAAIQQ